MDKKKKADIEYKKYFFKKEDGELFDEGIYRCKIFNAYIWSSTESDNQHA